MKTKKKSEILATKVWQIIIFGLQDTKVDAMHRTYLRIVALIEDSHPEDKEEVSVECTRPKEKVSRY